MPGYHKKKSKPKKKKRAARKKGGVAYGQPRTSLYQKSKIQRFKKGARG